MRSLRNSKQPVDGAPIVVTAPSLKDAYKIVRRDYGPDAVILGTRTVNQRQELGLGLDRAVEVTVQTADAADTTVRRPRPRVGGPTALAAAIADGGSDTGSLNQAIIREVDRIEGLVASIAEDHDRLTRNRLPNSGGPLAEALLANGASPESVSTLLTRFQSATGKNPEDGAAARRWLGEELRASNCTWDEFYGCHAFLGESGSGRTDLVLAAAGLLQGLGRRTLVLSVMPADNGDIKQLQVAAARDGYDAAVIKKETQLASVEKHLSEYDVVLLDMPALRHEAMGEGGPIQRWLAPNPGFHRHLLVPLDKDPRDMIDLQQALRTWNCDWITISRTDLSTRAGKLVDLLERVAAPISLWSENPMQGGRLEIAQTGKVLDSMLSQADEPEFQSGLGIAANRRLAREAE